MKGVLREFLAEISKNISALDTAIAKLEENPGDPALLDDVFRLVRSIKGECGYLDLFRLKCVRHAGEDVLSHIEKADFPVTSDVANLILSSFEVIKDLIIYLEMQENSPTPSAGRLVLSSKTLM